MSNHLRELIETCSTGELLFSPEASPRWHEFAPRLAISNGANAVCFFAGMLESWDGLTAVPELSKLPFDTCWIEFEMPSYFIGGLLFNTEDGICGHIWSKDKETKDWMFRCAFDVDNQAGLLRIQAVKRKEFVDVMAEYVIGFRCFLSAINCSNVRCVDHKPDEKLQKARAKRGKKPLFSYWTLELDLSKAASSESMGGTHASPRVHLRRGHARKCVSGKFTWVQPCIVGNKAAGIIHKDYAVKK